MRIFLILVGAAVVAYFLTIGIRTFLSDRRNSNRRIK